MAAPPGQAAPTERSPLLPKDASKIAPDASLSALSGLSDAPVADRETDDLADEAQIPAEDDTPGKGSPRATTQMHWLLPAVGIGIFLSAADQTIIVSSYGRIGSELNALNSTSWIATSYFLTLTSFQPLYGKLSDVFGRKPCLLFGYSVFGLGCLFCGLARTMPELIAARAFAGIGGGGMTTVVSILMSDIIPIRDRGTWQGYVNLIFAAGAASGAPLGGIFSDLIGWRWAFLVQAPLCLLAFLAVYFILDLPPLEQSHWKEKLKRIDFLGAVCLVIATSALLFGLDHGSNYSWSNKYTIIGLSLAIPLFAIFVFVEIKIATHPFAPGHIIFERSLTAAYLCNFFAFAAYISTIFYVPLYFQIVDGVTATRAGLRLIPGICGSVSGSLLSGFIMKWTGKYYALTIVAYTFMLSGIIPILLCTGLATNSTSGIIAGLVLTGFGGGIGVTTTLIALISNASPADQAIATACSYLFRSLGSVIGVSLSATIVQQALRLQLQHRLSGDDADEIVQRVRQSLDYIQHLDPAIRDVVKDCYMRSTLWAFALSGVLICGAVVSSLFIREKKLGK